MKLGLPRQSFKAVLLTYLLVFGAIIYRALNVPYLCEKSSYADLPLGRIVDSLITSGSWKFAAICILVTFNAVMMMRLIIRYQVNQTKDYTPLVLCLVGGYAMFMPVESLTGVLSGTLLVLASESIINSFRRRNRFGAVFGAMFCVGILLLLHSAFVVVLIIVPLMLLIFDRTAREAIVGLGGLVTPLIFAVFFWWVSGESPGYIFHELVSAITVESDFKAVGSVVSAGIPLMVFALLLLSCTLFGIAVCIANIGRMRTRTRRIHLYSILLFVVMSASAFMPSSNIFIYGWLGFPLCQIVSSSLCYTRRWVSILLYALIIVAATALNAYTLLAG